MWKKLFNHTGRHVRLILRRDRLRIPIWIVSIVGLTLVIAVAYPGLIPDGPDRIIMAETMRNPAVTAMFGIGYGLDNYTYGAIMAHQMLLFTALAVAIMSILTVVRHTRGDEDSGRIEMLRSLPVGRLSNLSATILVLFGANIIIALLTGFGLFALGIESMGLEGSLSYGAVLGATGIIFTAATALIAQLANNARGTSGYAFAFFGLAYLVRAIGDVSMEALSWFSPFNWVLRTEAYVNNYWWPILLTVGAAFAVTGLALYLNSIRDLEAGFIPVRPGRNSASAFLQSPLGLALKLQRAAIIGWAAGLFVLGASYGSVMGDLEAYLESMEILKDALPMVEGFSVTEQFMPMLTSVLAIVAAIPALLMINKVRGEEKAKRTEHLLARAVSRSRLLGSFLFIAVFFGFIALLLGIIGLWSAAAAVMDEPISFSTFFNAGMAYYPATLLLIGLAVLLIGIAPQGVGLTWLYLAYSFFVLYLGGLLKLPEWMINLAPYGFVPQLPLEEMNFAKIALLTAAAVLLMIGGFIGYRRRDQEG